MITEAVYRGIVLGLVLFISMGPIFFAVIETSIRKGFWYAFSISLGVLFSDALYILIAYFGLSSYFEKDSFQMCLGIGGGVMLIIFGVTYYLKKVDMHAQDLHIKKSSYLNYAFRGFIINTLNPFVILFWISTLGWCTVHFKTSDLSKFVFFMSVLATIFSTDMLKAYIAVKIQRFITPLLMKIVNIIAGTAMIVFGIDLLLRVFFEVGII